MIVSHDAGPVRRLFVHGFAGRPAMWSATREAARARGDASIVLPGHGPRPWYPSRHDFAGAVDALADGIEQRPWIVGYSLGARLSLALALTHPRRVAGAVLVGAHFGLDDLRERAAREASDEALAASIERDGLESFADAWARQPLFDSQRALSFTTQQAQRRERTEHTREGLAWSLRALGLGRMPSYARALAEAMVPLVLVTGALDTKFTALAARACDLARGRVRHIVVPDVGHNVALEAPTQLARLLDSVHPQEFHP